jgi:hypothetical protein
LAYYTYGLQPFEQHHKIEKKKKMLNIWVGHQPNYKKKSITNLQVIYNRGVNQVFSSLTGQYWYLEVFKLYLEGTLY